MNATLINYMLVAVLEGAQAAALNSYQVSQQL
jgi:hypothetical protein